jgi:hypothetical protein
MNFIWVVGPPAVGKMAVAMEISKKTGYRMLHNHGTIELLIPIFDYGTPKFNTLNNEFRKRIFEEVATSDLLGFIFTYVTSFELDEEKEYMSRISSIFKDQGHEVYFVELYAPLDIRIKRNKTPLRLEAKPSKRNTTWSEESLISMNKKYPHITSSDEHPFFFQENYIKIDNSNLTKQETAEKIILEFNLTKKV